MIAGSIDMVKDVSAIERAHDFRNSRFPRGDCPFIYPLPKIRHAIEVITAEIGVMQSGLDNHSVIARRARREEVSGGLENFIACLEGIAGRINFRAMSFVIVSYV